MKHVTSRLAALLAGELSEHEAEAVRAHLDSCPSCRDEHDRLARTWALLGGAGSAAAGQDASSVWPAVRARTVADRSHRGWRGAGWAVAALAAGVILGVTLPRAVPGTYGDVATDTISADESWLQSTWLEWDRSEDLAAGWILAGRDESEDGS